MTSWWWGMCSTVVLQPLPKGSVHWRSKIAANLSLSSHWFYHWPDAGIQTCSVRTQSGPSATIPTLANISLKQATIWSYTLCNKIHFHQKLISLSLNAEVSNSKCTSHNSKKVCRPISGNVWVNHFWWKRNGYITTISCAATLTFLWKTAFTTYRIFFHLIYSINIWQRFKPEPI